MLISILSGAGLGLLVARFFPDLGLNGVSAFGAGLGRAFGASKPYLKNAALGALAGAVVNFLVSKKD